MKQGGGVDREEMTNLKKSQQIVDNLIRQGYINRTGEPTKRAEGVRKFDLIIFYQYQKTGQQQ